MKTLNEIIFDHGQIIYDLVEAGGELTPEIEARITESESDLNSKLDRYAAFIARLKADADALKAEEDRLKTRRATLTNTAEKLRERMIWGMELVGETKIKTQLHSYSVRETQSWKLGDDLPDSKLRELEGLGYGRFDFRPDIKAIKEGEAEAPEWVVVSAKTSITIR